LHFFACFFITKGEKMSESDFDDVDALKAEVAKLRKENAALKRAAGVPVSAPKRGKKKAKTAAKGGDGADPKAALALFAQVKRNVKKQGHHQTNKPKAEAATAVWSESTWNAVTEGLPVSGKVRRRMFIVFAF
jgi:hypothetical protein